MKLKLVRLENTAENAEAIYNILRNSPTYCINVSGEVADALDGEDVFKALPEGHGLEDKHVLGIYTHKELIGIIDCLIGFPKSDCAHVGLLLLSEANHSRGLGREAYSRLEKYLMNFSTVSKIRLAVVRSNDSVLKFWIKMGFKQTGEIRPYSNKRVASESLLMEKILPIDELKVIQLPEDKIKDYVEHLHRHMSESGVDDIIYTPYEKNHVHPFEQMLESATARLQTDLKVINWERAFVVVDREKIVGHLDLRGAHLESALHRCRLGMGLDKEYRGKGLGNRLLNTAIKWVTDETEVDWIDLYTFSHNYPALRLYETCGFQEVGSIDDMFRVNGQKITDHQMVLKIVREENQARKINDEY